MLSGTLSRRNDTRYAFKWFVEDDKGALRGPMLRNFRYKKGRWQDKEYERPVMCRSGYHVVGLDDLFLASGQLWLVAVRGPAAFEASAKQRKSAWANVRPIKMLCTKSELVLSIAAINVPNYRVTKEGPPEDRYDPGLAHLQRYLETMRERQQKARALFYLWNQRFPAYGAGSYSQARGILRTAIITNGGRVDPW